MLTSLSVTYADSFSNYSSVITQLSVMPLSIAGMRLKKSAACLTSKPQIHSHIIRSV